MSIINWDQGQRITLGNTQTARCTSLRAGQLYGLLFYNSASASMSVPVTVTWSNTVPPVTIEIPASSPQQALAWIVLVSGSDTTTVSAAIVSTPGAQVDTWICSIGMPTDSVGLDNELLPLDGLAQPFGKGARYHRVPPSYWVELTIENPIAQFVSIQFVEKFATFYVVNPATDIAQRITALGSVTEGVDYVIQSADTPPQRISESVVGDGSTWVWMSADSEQNAAGSTIALQSLQMMK